MMQSPGPRIRAASPLSMQSNDSNFLSQYGSLSAGESYSAPGGKPSPGVVAPSQPSPPLSQHASTGTENSLASRPSSRPSTTENSQSNRRPSTTEATQYNRRPSTTENVFSNRPPTNMSANNAHLSTASSISQASNGAGFYSPTGTEFGRGPTPSAGKPGSEETLQRHYKVLKGFLAPYLRDEAGNTRPTRARDKLLRLSATQFHELSTDVYDELLRREDDRRRPGGAVPRSLPPRQTFHPKRNQARQKLSTLPPDRFRQLATDVFYELERRIPRLATMGPSMDMSRPGSAAGSIASMGRASTSSRQGGPMYGGRGPPPNGYRGPPGPGMRPPGPNSPQSPNSPSGLNAPPRMDSRPVPQTSQSSTIVPNKSTMVEDDETDEDDDAFKRSTTGSEQDKERLKEYASQVSEIQERVQELEEQLKASEAEVEEAKLREDALVKEKDDLQQTRAELDSQLMASQQNLENLHDELEQSHTERSQGETELRAQTDKAISDLKLELEELRRENVHLRTQQQEQQQLQQIVQPNIETNAKLAEDLANQRKITDQVRRDAQQFLQEMRVLSEQSDKALEKEEQLRSQIYTLEQETEHWKSRYTKAKTQVRSLRASTIGLGIQHESDHILRDENFRDATGQSMMRDDGLVKHVDVSAYQVSIDELLYAARDADTELALGKTKTVIKAVRAIVADIDGDMSTINSPAASSPVGNGTTAGSVAPSVATPGHPIALKAKVTRDSNRLVTAARTHATSHGLAPVSILDAAASNLTVSIVALLQTVGIRPSTGEDLNHESIGIASPTRDFPLTAPLHLQPRSFADTPTDSSVSPPQMPYVNYHSDGGMESPIIKGGFNIKRSQPEPRDIEAESTATKSSGGGGVSGTIGGWFKQLKSPALSSNKGSMIESGGESDDDDEHDSRYEFA